MMPADDTTYRGQPEPAVTRVTVLKSAKLAVRSRSRGATD